MNALPKIKQHLIDAFTPAAVDEGAFGAALNETTAFNISLNLDDNDTYPSIIRNGCGDSTFEVTAPLNPPDEVLGKITEALAGYALSYLGRGWDCEEEAATAALARFTAVEQYPVLHPEQAKDVIYWAGDDTGVGRACDFTKNNTAYASNRAAVGGNEVLIDFLNSTGHNVIEIAKTRNSTSDTMGDLYHAIADLNNGTDQAFNDFMTGVLTSWNNGTFSKNLTDTGLRSAKSQNSSCSPTDTTPTNDISTNWADYYAQRTSILPALGGIAILAGIIYVIKKNCF